MRFIDCALEDWRLALRSRGAHKDPGLERTVAGIIEAVRERGDEALLEIARRFDSPLLTSICTDQEEIEGARLPDAQEKALATAFERILAFHRNQVLAFTEGMEKLEHGWRWKMPSSDVGQRIRPLRSAGLYVPGGRASYPSSVLMLAGPATAAGVGQLTVTTPAKADGALPAAVLFAAKIAGISSMVKVGGASAIAALAFGTESVPKVDKVAGPGNSYVNEAKRQLWGSVGVDGQYGPSEVCMVIDECSNPEFAAADLLTQLEHAPDNLGFVVSIGTDILVQLGAAIERQVETAPRSAILRECLENVLVFAARDIHEAAAVVNLIAPEHLSLSISEPEKMFDLVENAGCVLLGDWTPESVADYCLGPCHTLPTSEAARFTNPVNVLDFLKIQSFGNLTRSEALGLVETVSAIAEAEGFPAHGFGTAVRK